MRYKVSLSLLVFFWVWSGISAQQAPPSFRNFVAVGDGYTAGMSNGSLNQEGQNRSYAAWLARQTGSFMFKPLISKPGVPNELILVDPGPPPVLETVPGDQGSRILPTIIPQNLAVPAASTLEALTLRPDLPLDSLTDLILGLPSLVIPQLGIPPLSQIEMAFVLEPSFTVLWLGPDDITRAAMTGSSETLPPLPALQEAYQTAVGTILAAGSGVIVGNFPDVTVLPFLSSVHEVAALAGLPVEVLSVPLGIEVGDYVTANGLPMVSQILQGAIEGPLPPDVVLTAEEVAVIQTTVLTMNAVIDQLGTALGFPVVDVNSFLARVDAEGVEVGGVTLTTQFLGGLYSLDGLYPTQTAHALLANLFIDELSSFYGLPIPSVDVETVAAQDPLFPQTTPSASLPVLMSITAEEFAVLRDLIPRRVTEDDVFDSGTDPKISEEIIPLGYGDREEDPLPSLHPGFHFFPGPVFLPDSRWREKLIR